MKSIKMTLLFSVVFLLGLHEGYSQGDLKVSDWKLGMQSWTMKYNTLEETLQRMDSLNIHYLEAFAGQKIGNGVERDFNYDLSDKDIAVIKKMLRKYNVKMVSMGVFMFDEMPTSELEKLFQFGQKMKLENISMEPGLDQLPLISELADEYGITVSLHNHMRPTRYWNTDSLLNPLKGLSSKVGALADIGHFLESNLDVVETIKALEGHINALHIKDANAKGPSDYVPDDMVKTTDQVSLLLPNFLGLLGDGIHNVPLGEGVINMAGIMAELKRQNFRGYFFIEHEYHFRNNRDEVEKSVQFFREIKNAILESN